MGAYLCRPLGRVGAGEVEQLRCDPCAVREAGVVAERARAAEPGADRADSGIGARYRARDRVIGPVADSKSVEPSTVRSRAHAVGRDARGRDDEVDLPRVERVAPVCHDRVAAVDDVHLEMRLRSAVAPVERVVLRNPREGDRVVELRRLGRRFRRRTRKRLSPCRGPRRTPAAQVVGVDREVVERAAAEAVERVARRRARVHEHVVLVDAVPDDTAAVVRGLPAQS